MQQLKWWQGDAYERSAINEAAAELQGLELSIEGLGEQLRELRQHAQAQDKHLARLQAVLGMVLDLMVERGLGQEQQLRDRVQAVVEALEPPKPQVNPAQQGGSPYRGAAGAPAPAPPERQAACGRCGQQVALSKTVMTEAGVVCDTCHLLHPKP